MNRLVLPSILALAASSLITGCLGSVVVDDRDRANANADGLGQVANQGSSSGATSGADAGPSAVVLRYGDIPAYSLEGASTSVSSGGEGDGIDPDQLLIIVSNHGPRCADPYGYGGYGDDCQDSRRLYIPLPVQLQRPGTVDLALVNAFWSELDGDPDPAVCWNGGGGGSVEGTLEITSIDEQGLRGTLTITSSFFDTSFLDVVAPSGALEATRCGVE